VVSSSKKKRGKQRKAAKSQSEVTKDIHLKNLSIIHNSEDRTLVEKSQHEKCAKLVQRGDNIATNAIKDLMGTELCCRGNDPLIQQIQDFQRKYGAPLATPNDDGTYIFVNISIEQSGILTTVLNFLKRCEDETFHQVMNSVAGKGDLVSPWTWVGILSRAEELEPSCSLQIAENIEPLVRCMCADTTRNFFNSNKHWREGITPFVLLVLSMISKSIKTTDREVANTLLQHEGLLSSIVQWGFWKDHRPDILKVLGTEECTVISDLGTQIVCMLVNETFQRRNIMTLELAADCRILMQSISTTPIISKDYDPHCMISYTAGYIQRMKTKGMKIPNDMMLLQALVTDIDCVDKGIITALINFGIFASDFRTAALVAGLSGDVLLERLNKATLRQQSDTRVAFAIRAGLIEMCLNFIDQYGKDDYFDVSEYSFLGVLEKIFTAIHSVSLHQKTAKAIRSKKIEIQGALARLEKKDKVERALAGIPNDMNQCEKLLDKVRSILNLNGSYCGRCNKTLSRTEVWQCKGCNSMTYCSRACQKEDWLSGHKLTCNEPYNDEKVGKFQGQVIPLEAPDNERDTLKLKDLEANMIMIQLKLFLDNAETILIQASTLEVPLYDCIVRFDLHHCPPTVMVVDYIDIYTTPEEMKCFEDSRAKDNITCVYFSPIFIGELGNNNVLAIQRLFPHEWLISKTS